MLFRSAVTLGARVIEKHFTDDTSRTGPDHAFSMDPIGWRNMVDRTRELENSLGSGRKVVEENESETVVLQRRAIRLAQDLEQGTVIARTDLEVLRPCPRDALPPYEIGRVVGRKLRRTMKSGEPVRWSDIE